VPCTKACNTDLWMRTCHMVTFLASRTCGNFQIWCFHHLLNIQQTRPGTYMRDSGTHHWQTSSVSPEVVLHGRRRSQPAHGITHRHSASNDPHHVNCKARHA
jgi:hypothetical protein